MKSSLLALWFLTVMMAIPCLLFAESFECKQGTVYINDSRVDMLLKCGEPDWKESHREKIVSRPSRSTKHKKSITVEEWTYNFGPNRFIRIITLRNGKITDIRTGDYGYSNAKKPQPREFSDRIVSIGESSGEVIAKWGEPAGRNPRQEKLKERLSDGDYRITTIIIDEWTYNLGPDRFMRILTFKNGKLTDINTGEYGYDRKQERH